VCSMGLSLSSASCTVARCGLNFILSRLPGELNNWRLTPQIGHKF
jgi:hypothetical protein